MKVIYKSAKQGNKFVMTLFGAEKAHVRSKFEVHSNTKSRFEKSVPKAWIDKGYVQEVNTWVK